MKNFNLNPPQAIQTIALGVESGVSWIRVKRMGRYFLIVSGWVVLLGLAGGLRLADLGERPIHADEATGARILADRMEHEAYDFDPTHFHGPWQSVISGVIARARGESSWEDLTVTTLRLGPVVAGLLTVLVPLLWVRPMGHGGAWGAGALLASSPLLAYYNRMFIHESWLALFGLLSVTGLFFFLRRPGWLNGVLTGVALGLMFATKETVAISGLSWVASAAVLVILGRGLGGPGWALAGWKDYVRPLTGLVGAGLVVSSFFYTNGFREGRGLVDAVRTFFVYETGAGQDKPFSYYTEFLLFPKNELGIWWTEAFVFLVALAGCWLVRSDRRAAVTFLVTAFLGHGLIYSLISYKTPWLMLLPWAQVCLLAGFGVRAVLELRSAWRPVLAVALLGGLAFQGMQSVKATGRYANDARNPYAYVPTTRDPERMAEWLREIQAMAGEDSLDLIAVTGSQYWPLPWYLRDFETVGYWPEPEESFSEFPVVLAMPGQAKACDVILGESHARFPRSLRDNVPVILYLRNDLWEQWRGEDDS